MSDSFPLYRYKAKVNKVYDGDTITVDIDLGLDAWHHSMQIRLAEIDTPEVRGANKVQGIKVRDIVRELILGEKIYLHTTEKGKYGRYLGKVYCKIDGEETCLNDWLVENGYAEYYSGRRR
ncbi:MAG: nuclease [Gammaproteobacteria bacterium]|nr:nuclease [Gammaproteobacteria bacterium]